jgi:predicted phosphoribosyltransferase
MYFKSRADAGDKLAQLLTPKYRSQNCAVVALSDGGVVVGSHIAAKLHCSLMLLLTEPIRLPGEPDAIGTIDQSGIFTTDSLLSAGQLEDYTSEYRNFLDAQKLEKLHAMNRLLGKGGVIDPQLLRHHSVILVSDGLNNGLSLDAAAAYLKPYRLQKLVMAVPIASVAAVDRMHILADEIYCLSVLENYIETNHYYEDNTLPPHAEVIKTIEDIVLNWK